MPNSEAWQGWLLGSVSEHRAKLSSTSLRKIPAMEALQSSGSFSASTLRLAGGLAVPQTALQCLPVFCFVFRSQKPKRGSIHCLVSKTSSEAKATGSQ